MLRFIILALIIVDKVHSYRFDLKTDSICAAENSQGYCTQWRHTGRIDYNSECFPGSSFVKTPNGTKLMSELQMQDMILVYDPKTIPHQRFEPVWFWLHRSIKTEAQYIHLKTNISSVTLSAHHNLAYIKPNTGVITYKFATDFIENDILLTPIGYQRITKLSVVNDTGLYAPFTRVGNFYVSSDGKEFYLTHCFANVESPDSWVSTVTAIMNVGELFSTKFHDIGHIDDYLHPVCKRLMYYFPNFVHDTSSEHYSQVMRRSDSSSTNNNNQDSRNEDEQSNREKEMMVTYVSTLLMQLVSINRYQVSITSSTKSTKSTTTEDTFTPF
jgi:hypothetical protein